MRTVFSPWMSLGGGLIIGLASAILWISIGKLGGVSGILKRSFKSEPGDLGWRLAFVTGLVFGGAFIVYFLPEKTALPFEITVPRALLAGAFVGIGTGIGAGCTSGHGICGLGRLSPRSFVAVLIFMSTAIAVTYGLRKLGL